MGKGMLEIDAVVLALGECALVRCSDTLAFTQKGGRHPAAALYNSFKLSNCAIFSRWMSNSGTSFKLASIP